MVMKLNRKVKSDRSMISTFFVRFFGKLYGRCVPAHFMGKEVRYDYEGKEVGILAKTFKNIVILQEDWIDTMNKQFAEHGYRAVLKTIKHWVREGHGEELTDAQAWLMLHHMTNQGVPSALRDKDADEKINPARYVAGSAMGAVDKTLKTVVSAVPKVGKGSQDTVPDDEDTQV